MRGVWGVVCEGAWRSVQVHLQMAGELQQHLERGQEGRHGCELGAPCEAGGGLRCALQLSAVRQRRARLQHRQRAL
jgi:hypothetical protein